MKTVYFDCFAGISGDMTLGALIDAGAPIEAIRDAIQSLRLPGCTLECESVRRKGIRGTKIHVRYELEHAHRHLRHIVEIVERGDLTPRQRELAIHAFRLLAEAEAYVHKTTVEEVHFHEVGAVDSIVDVVGSCVAWDLLGPLRGLASPVSVGGGTVEIAHGLCAVPAPATAELLKGVPLAESPTSAELTTPTGAALLRTLITSHGPMPSMTIGTIGYGAGDKDFSTHPNLLRVFVGESTAGECHADRAVDTDEVLCLETNLDDCTGEQIGYAVECLFVAGALDVATLPIGMKKGRPAIQMQVLARPQDRALLEAILFRETSTIGIRSWLADRSILRRQAVEVLTPLGPVMGKEVRLPDGQLRFAAEFDSVRSLAQSSEQPFETIRRLAEEAYARR